MRDFGPRTARLKPAGRLVIEALQALGLGAGLQRYSVMAQWEEIVGPGLVERCRPVGYKGGKLVVEVRGGATWRHQLHLMRQQMLDKVNALVAPEKVEDIRIEPWRNDHHDSGARPRRVAPPELESQSIDAEDLAAALEQSGLAADDPLRRALERWLRHSMQLDSWRAERAESEERK